MKISTQQRMNTCILIKHSYKYRKNTTEYEAMIKPYVPYYTQGKFAENCRWRKEK